MQAKAKFLALLLALAVVWPSDSAGKAQDGSDVPAVTVVINEGRR